MAKTCVCCERTFRVVDFMNIACNLIKGLAIYGKILSEDLQEALTPMLIETEVRLP